MKIDFIIQSLNGGGAERVMTTLANAFTQKHNIRIITFSQVSEDPFELDDKIGRINLNNGKWKNKTLKAVKNLTAFYRKSYNRPHLMISFIHSNNLIAILTSRFINIKLIVSEHTNHNVVSSKKVKFTREYLYRFANATTVLTSYDVDYYEKHGANVIIIPNPINNPKKQSEYNNREKSILAIGDLNRYIGKGFDNLLYILEPILKKNENWNLKIVGSGDFGYERLKEIVRKLNLEEKVIFTGFCKNVYELMQSSQIFVLSSKYEGLPMGLMEALSNGMACIAYNCPSGPSDLIKNFENGLLIENQAMQAMQDGLNELISDENLRNSVASMAPASMTDYSLDRVVQKWELLFKSIISENGSR